MTELSSGKKLTRKTEVSGDSAIKSDPTHHPSPASVLCKISHIVTRSHTKEDDLEKKEQKECSKEYRIRQQTNTHNDKVTQGSDHW